MKKRGQKCDLVNGDLWKNEKSETVTEIQYTVVYSYMWLVCIGGLPRTVLALLTCLMGAKGLLPQGSPANGQILSVVGA